MSTRPFSIPPGYHAVTPYIMVRSADSFIDFAVRALGAEPLFSHRAPDGRVVHAQFRVGDSVIMCSDETPEHQDMRGIESLGGSPMSLFLYVADADASLAQAVASGASVVYPATDQQYGRSATFRDPFGLLWHVTTPPAAV